MIFHSYVQLPENNRYVGRSWHVSSVVAQGRPGKPVQEGHFSTQIAGMKPAYIEELKAPCFAMCVEDVFRAGNADASY